MSPLPGIVASSFNAALPAFQGDVWALNTVTVTSPVSSITFTGIPQNYTHLQIRLIGRTSRTEYNIEDANLQINGDTNANYSWHRLFGNPDTTLSTVVSNSSANANFMNSVGILSTNGASTYMVGTSIIDILDYTDVAKNKVVRSLTGVDNNSEVVNGYSGFSELSGGAWYGKSPITSLTFKTATGTNFVAPTTIALYGVK